MTKVKILELYIRDLESKVGISPARNNKIAMLENELKQSLNIPDKDNYDYLRGFIDGEGVQEPKGKDDYPNGFNDINEIMDRMWELKDNNGTSGAS